MRSLYLYCKGYLGSDNGGYKVTIFGRGHMRGFKSLSLVGEWEGSLSDVLGNRTNLAINIHVKSLSLTKGT